jgi:hypothetical protein
MFEDFLPRRRQDSEKHGFTIQNFPRPRASVAIYLVFLPNDGNGHKIYREQLFGAHG